MRGRIFTVEERARGAVTRLRRSDARFWDRMDRSGGPDACWPWLGKHKAGGYGQLTRERRWLLAHRHAFSSSTGRALRSGEYVLHKCDNPPCCNPTHLYVGDQFDNMRDMVARGHHVGTRKHSAETIRAMRRARENGMSYAAIARAFDSDLSSTWRIVKGLAYREVQG